MSSKLSELRVLLSDDNVLDRLARLEKVVLLLVAMDEPKLLRLSGPGDQSGSDHFESEETVWPFESEMRTEDRYFCMSSTPISNF